METPKTKRTRAQIARDAFVKMHPGTGEIENFVRELALHPSGYWYLSILDKALNAVKMDDAPAPHAIDS